MAKQKPNGKRRKPEKVESANGVELKPAGYQPSKAELEEDLSVSVPLEGLAKAAVSGGASRCEQEPSSRA